MKKVIATLLCLILFFLLLQCHLPGQEEDNTNPDVTSETGPNTDPGSDPSPTPASQEDGSQFTVLDLGIPVVRSGDFIIDNNRNNGLFTFTGDAGSRDIFAVTSLIYPGARHQDFSPPLGIDLNIWYDETGDESSLINTIYDLSINYNSAVFHLKRNRQYQLTLEEDYWDFIQHIDGRPTLFQPRFSPGPGIYSAPVNVFLRCLSGDVSYYYTVNGNHPVVDGQFISSSSSITIDNSLILKVVAKRPSSTDSDLAIGEYIIRPPAQVPPSPDTYSPVISVFSAREFTYYPNLVIDELAGSDDDAVVYWLITESAVSPSPSDLLWQKYIPSTYMLDTFGSYTLYAWAMDPAGNISAPVSLDVEYRKSALTNLHAITSEKSANRELLVKDMNNDQLDDIIILSNESFFTIYYQQLDGSFISELYDPGTFFLYNGLAAGDIDNDADMDVILCHCNGTAGGDLELLYREDASFINRGTISTNICYQVEITDLDGDGADEIVGICGGSANIVGIIQQDGEGGLVDSLITYDTDYGGNPVLYTGDINSDNLPDIVVRTGAGYTPPDFNVLTQNADHTFNPPHLFSLPGANDLSNGAALGDIDNDGDNDLVVTSGWYTSESFVWFFKQGVDGLLQTDPVSMAVHTAPEAVLVFDINYDGLNDLILTDGMHGDLSVYLQQENGSFLLEKLYEASETLEKIALGDFNHDSYLDIVAIGYNSTIDIFYNRSF